MRPYQTPPWHSPDSFTFKANDGSADSNVATVSITVTPVNDAPVASDGTLTATRGTPTPGTLSATDADGTALTFTIVVAPKKGTITGFNASTGQFIYTSNGGAKGNDSFTFKANDGTTDSNVAKVAIVVR